MFFYDVIALLSTYLLTMYLRVVKNKKKTVMCGVNPMHYLWCRFVSHLARFPLHISSNKNIWACRTRTKKQKNELFAMLDKKSRVTSRHWKKHYASFPHKCNMRIKYIHRVCMYFAIKFSGDLVYTTTNHVYTRQHYIKMNYRRNVKPFIPSRECNVP